MDFNPYNEQEWAEKRESWLDWIFKNSRLETDYDHSNGYAADLYAHDGPTPEEPGYHYGYIRVLIPHSLGVDFDFVKEAIEEDGYFLNDLCFDYLEGHKRVPNWYEDYEIEFETNSDGFLVVVTFNF